MLFWLFDMSSIFIQDITTETKLTRHLKLRDQIDTIERLKTKLKYVVKKGFFQIKTYSFKKFQIEYWNL